MAVLSGGEVVPHLWAIGDATGKMMLAHAASAQGVVAVENICDRHRLVDYHSIPAAAFTHPEISFVGYTETAAKDVGKEQGFEVGVAKSYFKGNSKAIAEGEADGMAKVVYRKDSGEVLGVHIIGMHAADLIHEAANAIASRNTVNTLAYYVHAHPTLSEVLDEAYKRAVGSH
jgi:dihydrolipoamide dehydrogenase